MPKVAAPPEFGVAPDVSLDTENPQSPFYSGVKPLAPPAAPAFTPSADATLVAPAFTPSADATLVAPPFSPSTDAARVYTFDEFKARPVADLIADKDYHPVEFGVQNKAALLADPALQSKQEEVYKARELAGTTLAEKLKAAKEGALPGLEALYSGAKQFAKTGAKLGIFGASIPAVNAVKALTGPEGSGAAYVKDLGKSGAELAASTELASVGTADLLRRSARAVGENPLPPINPVNIALRVAAEKTKPEMTEGDWRNRYFNDVELAQKTEEAGRGNGEVMKAVGVDADTLKEQHGIVLDPQAISDLSVVTNPINYIPFGSVVGAVTSVGGKLVARGLAVAETAAQASKFAGLLTKASEAAAATKSVAGGVSGGIAKAAGGALEATGNAAEAGVNAVTGGAGSLVGGGLGYLLGHGPGGALEGLAIVKGAPKALQAAGAGLKRAGAVLAGEAPIPGALTLAGQTVKEAALGGLQAGVEGALITLPFEVGARPEEEKQLLGLAAVGAGLGAGLRGARPGVKATGRAAQNKLAETIFKRVEQADVPETPRYASAPEALNDAHDAAYAKLSPSDQKLVNWGRQLAPSDQLQIFALDSAGMKAETGSATAKGYAVKIAETPEGKPVVHIYLNTDAEALPHEFFHALEILDPKPAKALVDSVKSALSPTEFKAFEQRYNSARNEGRPEKLWTTRLTKDEVFREIAAEGFSRTFLAQDLSGVAPGVRQKAALFTASILEKLGAPLAGVNLKTGTPGASTLGVRPGTEQVKLGQKWLGDILNRVEPDGTLSATPTKAEPVVIPKVEAPVTSKLSAEDLDIAARLRKGGASDKAIARHFGLTPEDIVQTLGTVKGAKPAPAPAPKPAAPAPTPKPAAPTPEGPRNIRTTRAAQNDFAGLRSEVTGIEPAKAAAAAAGDANTVARVNEIADVLQSGNPVVEIEHSGAKSEVQNAGRTIRRAEQAGGVRDTHQKALVVTRLEVVGGKPQVVAMSMDKVLSNIDRIATESAAHGVSEKLPYPSENGNFSEATMKEIVSDLSAYNENQANGYRGDGQKLVRPAEDIGLSIPPENPDYTPRPLTEAKANFLNLAQGLNPPLTARVGKQSSTITPGNIKGALLAEANARKPATPTVIRPEDITKQEFKGTGRSVTETNPLRNELAAAGVPVRELIEVTERINAKDISKVTPRPELDFKAPVTDTIRGGFLPDPGNSLPGEELTPGNYWLRPDGRFQKVRLHRDAGPQDALYSKGWIRAVVSEAPHDARRLELNDSGFFRDENPASTGRVRPNEKQLGAIEAAKSVGTIVQDDAGYFLPGETPDAIKSVQDMTGDEFANATRSWDGGLTKQAWKVGLDAASPEDVTALKTAWTDAREKFRASMKEKDINGAGSWANKSQFFREAFEAATDTESAAGPNGWRNAFPDRQAPFPALNMGDFLPASKVAEGADPIVGAAVQDSKGEVHTGVFHAAILAEHGFDEFGTDTVDGFVTRSGKFLNRDEALAHAKEINQLRPGSDSERLGYLESDTFRKDVTRQRIDEARGNFLPGIQTELALRNGQIKDPKPATPSGDEAIRTLSDEYRAAKGLTGEPHRSYDKVNVPLAKKLAEFYDAAKDSPEDPKVKASYEALADETLSQYQAMLDAGYTIEPYTGKGEPYKSSADMVADVRDNKHLYFLQTGGNFSGAESNPMLKTVGGGFVVNDVFRAVHDFFGHAKEGYQFGPRGELNAWKAHSTMFTPEAQGALAAETLAQNSWVNYGKHVKEGTPLKDRPFAEQKAVIVPQELIDEAKGSFLPREEKSVEFFNSEPPAPITSADAAKAMEDKTIPGRDLMGSGWMFRDGQAVEVDAGYYHDDIVGGIKAAGKVDARSPEQFQAETGAIRIGTTSSARAIGDYGDADLGISMSRKMSGSQRSEILKLLEGKVDEETPHFGKVSVDITKEDGTIYSGRSFEYPAERGKLARFLNDPFSDEFASKGDFLPTMAEYEARKAKEGKTEKKKPVASTKLAAATWILPDGEVRAVKTQFHEQDLAANRAEYNKKFGTKFTANADTLDRNAALDKGFVRIRYQAGNGLATVEVGADSWTKQKAKVLDTLVANADKIDKLRISLVDKNGHSPDSVDATLFNAEDRGAAITDAVNEVTPPKSKRETKLGPSDIQRIRALPGPGDFLPSDAPGAVKEAAVRDAEGRIFGGRYHGEAIDRAQLAKATKIRGYSDPTWDVPFEVGFVTNDGEYLTREQAFERGKKLFQLPEGYELRDPENGIHASELRYAFLPGEKAPLLDLGLPSEEKMKQIRVKTRVNKAKENFPEALVPEYQKDAQGKFVLGEDGKPKPRAVEYNFMDTPLAREAAKGERGAAREEAYTDALAKKLVVAAKVGAKRKDIQAGAKWYSTTRTRLRSLLGDDSKFFAELLGATSARTPVETNFRFSVDAYNQFKAGEFDGIIKKYREGKDLWDAGKLPEDFTISNPTRGQFLDWWVKKYDLSPTQSNGKKFGANSRSVLRVLDGSWREEVQGPKTPNFAGNLSGDTFAATIDVWAARLLHRLSNEGGEAGKRWRILPENETGVTDADFALGQEAYRKAADKLGMKPDSLQAVLWFLEKDYWEKKGWTRGAGAAKSDFQSLLAETERTSTGSLRRKTAQNELAFGLEPSDIQKR